MIGKINLTYLIVKIVNIYNNFYKNFSIIFLLYFFKK